MSNNNISIDSDPAVTPPQLSSLGLCRSSKMSKMNESQRLLRSQTADKDDDELFVKLPKFTKRARGKSGTLDNPEDNGDANSKTIKTANERLCKFLKQPKCQRWIWCEFIESFIDKAILASGYSQMNDKKIRFAQLETDQLPRRCWQFIRRIYGQKPRRFGPAFIANEKAELERYRNIIRQLQQYKLVDAIQCVQSLPKHIPMQLPVDAKVISLLSSPLLMLCKGRVVGYEPKDCSYLVKFDMAGKHIVLSMADCYLHALHDSKSVPLADILGEASFVDDQLLAVTVQDALKDQKRCSPLLAVLLQLKKKLSLKRKTVNDIVAINEELEAGGTSLVSQRRDVKLTPQREKLQHRFAANMITLHRVNANILENMRVAQEQLVEYEKDYMQNTDAPSNKILEKCRFLAERDLKASTNGWVLNDQATRELILKVHTLIHLCSELGHGNDIEVNNVLDDYLLNILTGLAPVHHAEFHDLADTVQKLRDQIGIMSQRESERRQQQLQQSDNASLIIAEESDFDMGF